MKKTFTINKAYDIISNRLKRGEFMNQILSVDNPNPKRKKQKNGGGAPANIKSIVRFFAIAMIVFGVFMIGTGSYSMYKNYQDENTITKPTIYVERTSDEQLTLKITHDKALAKVTYIWQNGEEIDLNISGRRDIEQALEVPTGTNTLRIYAQDINGQETSFTNTYTRESGIQLSIENQEDGNNILISASSQEQLSYLTYRWDEEDETRVDINDTQIDYELEPLKGTHKLTVIVVDINNNTQTQEIEVQGVTRPTLEVTADDGENFTVKMSDEQGLDRVEFIINEDKKYRVNLNGVTEHEFSYALQPGENRLNITLYNVNGVTTNRKVKYTK